jgi:hypothetical protein
MGQSKVKEECGSKQKMAREERENRGRRERNGVEFRGKVIMDSKRMLEKEQRNRMDENELYGNKAVRAVAV